MTLFTKQVIRMSVVETIDYRIDLDISDLDIPKEIMGDKDAVHAWLEENEDVWMEQCVDSNYYACLDRDISEIRVVTLKLANIAEEMAA
ncbi:hypothetical protein [Streptosporangium subroseum]|uniref:hypothetical protein n=1 Tax=Streptosporangium subroseum TaxID=106412 RepID=UPI00308A12D3|nr:hypothetical protein OHB15_14030 [Streptosporangium subroseum]